VAVERLLAAGAAIGSGQFPATGGEPARAVASLGPMVQRRRQESIPVDDLRGGFDPEDESARGDLPRRGDASAGPRSQALRPGPDELVCRSCRMLVRRPDLRGTGVALLVCGDCAR
jgi:hypothetical protein